MSKLTVRSCAMLAAGILLTGSAVARAGGAMQPSRIEAGVLGAGGSVDVLARFERALPSRIASLDGVRIRYRFTSLPAVFATVTPAGARALAALPGLAYLERDKPIAFDIDSANRASRARDVWSAPDPVVVGGAVVDGAGVGIAIVDTGLDGLHPDFQAPGKVGGNWAVAPKPVGLVAAPFTAGTSAHGTHVAGIAAGNGLASGGAMRGVAPGATLYAFGVGTAASIAFPSVAFDWIIANGDRQAPPIRVVNNSWHCASAACRAFNPEQLHIRLASQLAEGGRVVTWAAGNNGGSGVTAVISAEATNPSPGIIGVANYDDGDRGARDSCVTRESSRGAATDPTTWPDLAAPGQTIRSTWAMGANGTTAPPPSRVPVPDPGDTQNHYRTLSGTSMAAAHAAGVAALVLQARPAATPADVEYLLKATATKLSCGPRSSDPVPLEFVRADPAHPWDGANYVAGHGLIDALAAVRLALEFTAIPAPVALEPLPDRFHEILKAIDPDTTLYLRGDSLSGEEPDSVAVVPRPVLTTPETFSSEPFAGAYTADGAVLGLWYGESHEFPFITVTGRTSFRFSKISGGMETTIIEDRIPQAFTPTAGPIFRKATVVFPTLVTFAAGDVLRFSMWTVSGLPGNADMVGMLYQDSATTPSAIGLGGLVPRVEPGSSLECALRNDCVEVGAERRVASIHCENPDSGEDNVWFVEWFGPPGSGIAFSCFGVVVAACYVPGEEGDPWGDCKGSTLARPAYGNRNTVCTYVTRDGAPTDGRGKCWARVPIGT